GIETVVSGDISEVHGASNWISERAAAAGMKTFLPLWHSGREEVIQLLFQFNFETVLTLVKEPWLNSSFLGRKIDEAILDEFKALEKENGLDLCGEQGE